MAPVILRARQESHVEVRVCTTGQHREMLDQVLQLFDIRPDIDLNLMQPGQTLSSLTAQVLTACQPVFQSERPDWILVHGDTTTTLAASLAAYYAQVPVAHIEAGLRTGNLYSPWPEELNRKLTAGIAQLHFAPTEQARQNLLREGVEPTCIHVTGNTVIDALQSVHQRIEATPKLVNELDSQFPYLAGDKRIILVTGHRRENFGAGFTGICEAILKLAERGDVEIVYPVHLNPNVKGPVHDMLGAHPRVHLISPMDYLPFVRLLARCSLILTDSGGIQEEAPALGKPVLVMRDTTERPEAIVAGTAALVGTNADRIVATATRLLDDASAYTRMAQAHNPYGDGHASDRIVDILGQKRR